MKLTRQLALSQLRRNRRRTMWTVLGIMLSTTMITTVYGLVASTMALVETIWEGSSLRLEYEAMMASLGVILSVVIVASSIVVLSNAFRVSAKERAMQFGILKSVGATKTQIRQTVVSESLLLAAVGIPIGLLLGMVVHFIGVGLINHFLADLFQSARPGEDMMIRFVFSWQAILLSIVLALATVLLSAWLPARKASKIPAIDAIRGAGEVKVENSNVRGGWIVGKLFGVEGMLAARSLWRSRRNFRATTVALSLSVALVISLGSFVAQMNRFVELTWPDMEANVVVGFHANRQWVEGADGVWVPTAEYVTVSREMAEMVSRRFEPYTDTSVFGYGRDGDTYSVILPREMLTPELLEWLGDIGTNVAAEDQWFSVLLLTVDPVHYAILAERAGVPEGSNILVNHRRTHTMDGRRSEFEPLRFSGQTLQLTGRLAEGGTFERELTLHGVLGIGEVPNEILRSGTSDVTIIVPFLEETRRYTWFIATEDPFALTAYAFKMIEALDFSDEGNWHVFNAAHEQEMTRSLTTLVMTFVWGFVGLLTLIYLTNIISTISANVLARAQEFAVLQSVGMTRGGIARMLNLESVLSSVKALFIGVPLGILGAYGVYHAITEAAQFAFALPWAAIALSVFAVFLLTWIVMRYAARQLRRRNIVDTIRAESGM
ncbi:MAG: ABC transporter permease [Oscillospiraceae bacterium]|nr:ABC transporter permease [Oscillospiraceae bacterium]